MMPRDNSLRSFLFSRFIAVALAVFIVVLFAASVLYYRLLTYQVQETMSAFALQAHNMVATLMLREHDREGLRQVLAILNKPSPLSPFQVETYRGPSVEEQYGRLPKHDGFADDPIRAKLFAEIFALDRVQPWRDPEGIRHIHPLVAEQRCLACHAGAEVGSVLGLVEVRQSLSKAVVAMKIDYLWLFLLLGAATVALVVRVSLGAVNRVSGAVRKFREKTLAVKKVNDLPTISQLGQDNLSFAELNQAFEAVGELAQNLHQVAVDKDILELKIKILGKIIITSEVVQDWRKIVKEILWDINAVLDVCAVVTFFRVDGNNYELDVFWRSSPANEAKNTMEALIRRQVYGQLGQINDATTIKISHHHDKSSLSLPPQIDLDSSVMLHTKSFFLDSPQVGGVFGITVHLDPNLPPTAVDGLVLNGLLATLINLVGSAKAIYLYTQELEHAATHDPLTQLYNLRTFRELLDYEVGQARSQNHSLALLIINLDNFKTVNDRYGYAFGDLLLQEVAKTLSQVARSAEPVARYSGDEFSVLLPATTRAQALVVAERLRELIAAIRVPAPDGASVQITASLGLATYPDHGNNAREIFLVADRMMLKIKGEGKDAIAEPATAEVVQIRKASGEISLLVYRALEEKTVMPFFQPILNLHNGQVEAHEVLMRIPSADGRIIPANEFIQTAGQTGLLQRLDQLLMEKTFQAVIEQNYQGQLFFNITPRSFIFPEFFPRIQELICEFAINPQQIVFEVTERDTTRNEALLQEFVTQMKAEGYRFAVDDFGSGYSSYKYLKLFSIDYLKIEGEFIRNLLKDRTYLAYVKSINALARELRIKTVAEFIEDQAIMTVCRETGIDFAQGYHIARPSATFYQQAVSVDPKRPL